jgi:hypothetical protein
MRYEKDKFHILDYKNGWEYNCRRDGQPWTVEFKLCREIGDYKGMKYMATCKYCGAYIVHPSEVSEFINKL